MERFLNRQTAGQALALALKAYANRQDAIVLALPRGGVPVAFEIATALHLPLDVFLVRKLGLPGHEELAMGAIAMDGSQYFNQEVLKSYPLTPQVIDKVIKAEQKELKRRELAYRGKRPPLQITNKVVILVDDGIATGATMRVAVKALRQMQPTAIVIAVPVAQADVYHQMQAIADKVICPLLPEFFYAVGAHYEEFSQTSDEEVKELLSRT